MRIKTQVDVSQAKPGQIEDVYVLLETSNVVLAYIITKDTYPEVGAISGGSGLILKHQDGWNCRITFRTLPFENPHILYTCGRCCIDVCIFDSTLRDKLEVGSFQHVYNEEI